MQNVVDHVAIGASSLVQGTAAVKDLLGVMIPGGGKHPLMSTHNCVAQAGHQRFVEIIAIDPDAPAPARTRWFSLDDPTTQSRLAIRPRALCWVVNTSDLDSIIKNSPVDLGVPVNLTRGALSWRLTVPVDGSLPEQGLLPAFIEWAPGEHPSAGMQNLGINLETIHLGHPDPASFTTTLKALHIDHLIAVHASDEHALSFSLSVDNGPTVIID